MLVIGNCLAKLIKQGRKADGDTSRSAPLHKHAMRLFGLNAAARESNFRDAGNIQAQL